jgi:hypothetical protein
MFVWGPFSTVFKCNRVFSIKHPIIIFTIKLIQTLMEGEIEDEPHANIEV